ncbi:WD40 repeat-like protein [Sistotremastrum niveocremeum HHB9708]|uniref:WD40 repeat-like protein n=1 Tax=Sistotremastrum niveocremeum HHB9708 TaxID=1314777 RepID=A0A164VN25_9AGAM|nr:WD40 repeat-like protein [Sistotremastrum niveocremeum HHB9708]
MTASEHRDENPRYHWGTIPDDEAVLAFFQEEGSLNAPSGEILTIRVFYEKKGKEKLRCEAEDVVVNLDVSKPLDKVIRVSKWVNGTVPDLHLDFRLTISSLGFNASKPAASDHVALPTVLETSPAMDHAFDEIHRLGDGVDAMQPIGESLATVIDNVDPVFKIIEDISEIHPYAKLAFSIVTAAYTVLKAQRDRDDKVNDLITTMRETYEAIWAAKEKWENADSLNAVWDKVSDVTMDCCNFISKYRETKAFTLRAIQNVASKTDKTIKDFEGQFEDIKGAFQTLTAENIHAAVIKIRGIQLELLDEVQDLHVQVNLNDMIYPRGANFDPKKACLPDTREHALYVLQQFASGLAIDTQTEANHSILWIKGAAGTGKSFIAHRLLQILSPRGKIGSSFFFNYRTQKDAPPHSLIPRISQDLAGAYPAWKLALTSIIGKDRSLRHETSIIQQFESLLIQPALAVFIPQPILFVIDGLDEAGDREERAELIEVLTTRLHELPSNFRFVLFSRPERDIVDAFSTSSYHISLDMKDLCAADDKDIETLVEHKFKPLKAKPENAGWLTDKALSHLVLKSGGLMVFAGTACDYIIIPISGSTFAGRLRHILELDRVPKMDTLYSVILQANIGSDRQAIAQFQTVMGRMVCLRDPLPYDAYLALDRHGVYQDATETTLPFMTSILYGVQDRENPISPIHKSFTDFLIDQNRSLDYHISQPDHYSSLLRDCLSEMAKNLRFNICGIESSYIVQDSVKPILSPQLRYACRFWAEHLVDIPYDAAIAADIKTFFETSLLDWFQVLNYIGYENPRYDLVALTITWSQWDDMVLTEISTEVEACLRQTDDFKTKSGPHVYLSALPYVAPTNWVHRRYRHQFHHLPVVTSELLPEHNPLEKTLFHVVRDGAIPVQARWSPDGAYILVSNGLLFVSLDSTSYQPIWRHKRSDNTGLRCWQFSPDGNCIYLLGQNFELEVMQLVDATCRSSLIKIHPTEDMIHAVISPDCRFVRSVTKNGALQQWCTQTGKCVTSSTLSGFDLFDDQCKVALSTDGENLLRWGGGGSGYQICYWTAERLSPSIFKGHTALIREAIYSFDNTTIFLCDDECTIRAWSLHCGQEKWRSEVHEQHANSPSCLAASRDNQLVASGSEDYTVRLWDATNGRLISKPLQSQHGSPNSLEFSPNGKRLLCITTEGIVYLWNVELALSTPYPHAPPIRGEITGIRISSDSSLMAVAVGFDILQIQQTNSTKVLAQKSVRSPRATYGVLAFSPENSLLAYADNTHSIGLWHWQTPEQDHHLCEGHTDEIRSLCFSPNAELLLSASDDQTIRVWDIRSGTASPFRVIQTNGMSLPLDAVPVFTEGRNWIVSADYYEYSIKVWDLDAEEPFKQDITWPNNIDLKLALSPNGGRLLSASKNDIQLWNMIDGQLSKFGDNLEADHGDVCSAAFSPDSCKIAVGFGDKTIQIWDVDTGKKFGAPLHSHCRAQTLAFTPDGRQIMAASKRDGLVHIWDIAAEPSALPWNSKPAGTDWFSNDPWDGWVYDTGPNESRLFWVPERFRPGFVWSDRHRVIGVPETRVDISDFVHGKDWTKCWKGPTPVISDSAS